MSFTFRLPTHLKLVVLLALPLILLPGCGENGFYNFPFEEIEPEGEEPILIGQVPSRSIVEIVEQREDFLTALGRHLNRDVQFRFAASYEAMVERLKNQKYDLAILGPLAYVQAARLTSYRPLVKPVRFGRPYYRSIIFTHQDSGLNEAGQIAGQSIAFVDPDSASGYLFPRAHLISNFGFDPIDSSTRHLFAGSHDRVVRAVLERNVSAGATFDDARTLLEDEGAVEKLKILARTEPIPSEPVVASKKLRQNDSLREKILSFFLKLNETDTTALKSLGEDIESFRTSGDTDYDRVRSVADNLGLLEAKQ